MRVNAKAISRAAAVAVVVPLLTGFAVPAASADDATSGSNPNRFSLTAEGDGMYIEYNGQAAPATDTLSASPWASFASVDSQASSRAFAGLPYEGAFLQTIPSTVNGLSGGATPPLPPLPGYVETKYPAQPTANQDQGPYSIQANSAQYASSASAASGFSPEANNPQHQIYSSSKVTALADGTVSSIATAGVRALSLGPLQILNFGNTETLTETGDGKPVMTTETDLGTFEVAGIKVGVTQKGFTVGNGAIEIPAGDALNSVNSALAGAGMEIAYIPRSISKDDVSGVTKVLSGALRVRMLQDVPGEGPTRVTYLFGRATVGTSDVKDESVAGGLPVDLPSVPAVPVAAIPDTSGVVNTPVTADIPTTTGLDPSVSSPVTSPDLPDLGTQAGSAPAAGQVLGSVPALNAASTSSNTSLLYLVLVLGGGAVLVGQQLFSRFGIRLLMRA